MTQRALKFGLALALLLFLRSDLQAQQLIGYVSTKDADVTGATDVVDGHAVLSGSVAVTAKDHTAPITLGRGGIVRVCQTSILHLTESKAADLAAPLLLSLDRGAIEIQMTANSSDAVMTPDLRFSIRGGGPLDLRMRVARNGDTCVENRGPGAPTLAVSDPFGEALYELLPTQHVLFEHGSLHEVVDHESIPCGCPETAGMSIADALLAPAATVGSGGKAPTQPAPSATPAQQPFPTAVSEGLAPAPVVPQAAPGQMHTQIADALTYNAQPAAEPVTAAAVVPPPPSPSPAKSKSKTAKVEPAPDSQGDFVHIVGHFFHKLFGHS
jgi:hypothetical protein